MITEWAGYKGLTDRHAKEASYTPAGCRETVIRVPHDRPIKVGDIVQHEVSPGKKIPVVVQEIMRVVPMGNQDWVKIFYRKLKEGEEKEMERKTCPHCGKPFIPASGRQEYCSKQCRIAAADKKRLEAKAEEMGVPGCIIPDGPDDPAAGAPEMPEVNPLEKMPAGAAEPDIQEVPDAMAKAEPSWRGPEPSPDDKNIKAVKKILKLIPTDDPYTLKISLESGSIQLAITIAGEKNEN